MGISDFIAKKKALKPIRKREYIELRKPVINLFIGQFTDSEKKTLKDLLTGRIGENNKVNYLNVAYGNSASHPDGSHECTLTFSDVEKPEEHGTLKQWEELNQGIKDSRLLEQTVRDYVNNIFNEVSTVPYIQKASIRLNLLIQMDSVETAILETLAESLKTELLVFFNNGVSVDAYCFLDQKGYRADEGGENRKAYDYLALQTVNAMVEKKLVKMAYCLSNYTSQECLQPDSMEERIRTAALTMLLKDGGSALSKFQVDTYDDDSFVTDCSGSNGNFYSLGHFKLEAAVNLIDYIVYDTVFERMSRGRESHPELQLERMELTEEQMNVFCQELLPITSFPPSVFFSMVKNSGEKASMIIHSTRAEVIESVYGQNLNLFYKFNCERNYETGIKEAMIKKEERITNILKTMYTEENYSLSDMNTMMNGILEHLTALKADCLSAQEAELRDMQIWLGERNAMADLRSVVKETKEPMAFYQIAMEYLDKMVRGLHLRVKLLVLDAYVQMIQRTARQYHSLSDKMAEAVEELKGDIDTMMVDGIGITTSNVPDYYGALTENILSSDNQFEIFEKELNHEICSGDIDENYLFGQIIQYCDEKILSKKDFEKDFSVEMLKRLRNFEHYNSEESIYEYAFETIMENKVFYADVVTFDNLHETICFMVNPDNRFVTSTNSKMQQLKDNRQLKIFFEEHYDDMDVLYMEGHFGLESLYNYQIYENVYGQLKK